MDSEKFGEIVQQWLNNMKDKAEEMDKVFISFVLIRDKKWEVEYVLDTSTTVCVATDANRYDLSMFRESIDIHFSKDTE